MKSRWKSTDTSFKQGSEKHINRTHSEGELFWLDQTGMRTVVLQQTAYLPVEADRTLTGFSDLGMSLWISQWPFYRNLDTTDNTDTSCKLSPSTEPCGQLSQPYRFQTLGLSSYIPTSNNRY